MSIASHRFIHFVILAVALLTFGASGAHAQAWNSSSSSGPGFWNRGFEITPFGGSRFGGVIDVNAAPQTIDYLGIRSTWDYGVMLDVDLFPHAQAEFMWNEQPTVLSAHDYSTDTSSRVGEANLAMYQWSFLYQFLQPGSKFQPYAVAGLGFTNYDTHGIVNLNNEFAWNVGGGVKYFFTPHVGVRVEGRYSPSRTEATPGTVCGFFECFPALVPNYAHQGQANVGVIFRF
jgi:opacity protein-like surface antigen